MGKKYSIYCEKTGKVRKPKEGSSCTVCHTHILLANIAKELPGGEMKDQILSLIDTAYDMGKRMGNKLKDNHRVMVKHGLATTKTGWRDGF